MGNVTANGLGGSNGAGLLLPVTPPILNAIAPHVFVLIGDSLTSRGAYNVAATSVTARDGLLTIDATTHGAFPGANVMLANASVDWINGVAPVESVVNANNLTIRKAGAPNGVVGGTTQLINNQSFRDLNFFEMANASLGHPFIALRNVGMPGQTLTAIVNRWEREVLEFSPHGVQLQGGINDVVAAASDGSGNAAALATMINAFTYMLTSAVARGIYVVTHTLCPLGTVHGSYSLQRNQLVLNFNRWLREYAAFFTNYVDLVDAHRVVVDATTGDWAATLTSDGIHPNAKAAQLIAIEQATVMGKRYATRRPWITTAVDNYTTDTSNPNIIVNPLLLNSGGTLSTAGGGTGTNTGSGAQLFTSTWTRSGTGTCVASLVARSDGLGNNQRFTCSPNNASDSISMLSNGMQTRVAAGDVLIAEVNLAISAIAQVSNVFFSVDWSANGVTYTQPCGMITGSDGQLSTDFNWTLFTNPFIMPAAPTTLRIRVTVTFAGAATNVLVDIGALSFFKCVGVPQSRV